MSHNKREMEYFFFGTMHVSMKQQDSLLLLVAGRRSYSMGSHQLMAPANGCENIPKSLPKDAPTDYRGGSI
ncbi:uncharacterized protein YALI1_C16694g [Yarrowia lipolytica]|uniref:Uncharacterized protein n=1 Tax=Yarrowia lipolytica TaxID=4952 RepID=A0A1D8NAR8_YARLL|nr:hypothetical protein YALI1_C16694g [Yarrowia lipolytica]